jgi:hypothetical protein
MEMAYLFSDCFITPIKSKEAVKLLLEFEQYGVNNYE